MAKSILKVDKDEVKKVVGSILGGEEEKELDLPKSHEKFKGMYTQTKRYALIFEWIANDKALDPFPKEREIVQSYANLIHTEMKDKFENYDLNKITKALDCYPMVVKETQEDVSTFLKYYNAMKQSTLIHTIINTGNNLVDYKKYLANVNELDDSFIVKSSMLTLEPVQDLQINFKLLYTSMTTERDKKFILLVLHKLYDITTKMYEERGKVDIDTGAFVKAVHATVEKLRKDLPRCEQAFKKILDSTDLLRENYDSYYKDYVGCNNSMVIAENFIHDVAGKVDRSPRLALQFRKIINHLRKVTNRLAATDPRYKQTFDTLLNHADKSYKEVEKALADDGQEIEDEDESSSEIEE